MSAPSNASRRKLAKDGSPSVPSVVELFAGIGGFRIAADRLHWRTVWANDLCPRASAVYRDRFGDDSFREGDFAGLKKEVPHHDVLTGGFPCQPFSSAGKKQGLADPRGTLFQHIVDVIKSHRPTYFLLENVKRLLTMEQGRHFATILGALADLDYSIEWRLLNAMHFGLPQNRERLLITGVRSIPKAGANEPLVRLATASDLSTVPDAQWDRIFHNDCWTAISNHKSRFPDWGLAWKGRFAAADLTTFSESAPMIRLLDVLEDNVSDDFDFTNATQKWIANNDPVNRLVNGVEIISNQKGGARMGYTIFGTSGVAPTLTSTTSRHYERYRVGNRYRRLTNVEYARIQGFPDDHCRAVSVYDQYALIGNAVPPSLVEWAMKRVCSTGVSLSTINGRFRPAALFDNAY